MLMLVKGRGTQTTRGAKIQAEETIFVPLITSVSGTICIYYLFEKLNLNYFKSKYHRLYKYCEYDLPS